LAIVLESRLSVTPCDVSISKRTTKKEKIFPKMYDCAEGFLQSQKVSQRMGQLLQNFGGVDLLEFDEIV